MDQLNMVLNDCKDIMKSYFSECVEFKLEQYSQEKLGYLADHFLLTITTNKFSGIHKSTFFVKAFPTATYEVMRKYIIQASAFKKEILVYDLYFPSIRKYLPQANLDFAPKYFASKANEMVVLENLQHEGYRLADTENLDDNHIVLALKTIARFHALNLAYEESRLTSTEKRLRLIDEHPQEFQDGINRKDEAFIGYQYMKAAHKGVLALIDILPQRTLTKDELKKRINKTFEDIFTLLGVSNKYRNVLCHGDLWYKNIMFKYENDKVIKCKLVDFQLIRYSPPANDVLLFLLHADDNIIGKPYLEQHLGRYYEFLTHELKGYNINAEKVLPKNEFKMTCDLFLPPLKLKHIYHVSLSEANPSNYMKNVYAHEELYTETLFEDRTEMITYLVKHDDSYMRRMLIELDNLEYVHRS